jgi:hypothetical protein
MRSLSSTRATHGASATSVSRRPAIVAPTVPGTALPCLSDGRSCCSLAPASALSEGRSIVRTARSVVVARSQAQQQAVTVDALPALLPLDGKGAMNCANGSHLGALGVGAISKHGVRACLQMTLSAPTPLATSLTGSSRATSCWGATPTASPAAAPPTRWGRHSCRKSWRPASPPLCRFRCVQCCCVARRLLSGNGVGCSKRRSVARANKVALVIHRFGLVHALAGGGACSG